MLLAQRAPGQHPWCRRKARGGYGGITQRRRRKCWPGQNLMWLTCHIGVGNFCREKYFSVSPVNIYIKKCWRTWGQKPFLSHTLIQGVQLQVSILNSKKNKKKKKLFPKDTNHASDQGQQPRWLRRLSLATLQPNSIQQQLCLTTLQPNPTASGHV